MIEQLFLPLLAKKLRADESPYFRKHNKFFQIKISWWC